jgi:hypothetical protein
VTNVTLVAIATILGVLLIDVVFCLYLIRVERANAEADVARLERLHAGERERLVKRVEYLEFQLANHVAHVLKLPPPAPPMAPNPPDPLPEVMQSFLAAIEDEESRGEFETDFRARLALGLDPHAIVAEAMSG